jgi:glycerophosphoryl diester phosphodiesterase
MREAGTAFDLQGHRGARGLRPENTLAGFAHALSIGVSTLELDTGVTKDGVVVVSHDQALNPDHTRDAAGNWLEGAGPAIFSMTFAELQRFDVGRLRPGTAYANRFPDQVAVDGERIPRLAEVFELVKKSGNTEVRFNIETKIDPRKPEATLPADAFADALVREIRFAGVEKRTMIQSFDWRTLKVAQRIAPEIETVCLTTERGEEDNVGLGNVEPSPWLGGLSANDFGGSVPKLVQAAGASVWSPDFKDLTPSRLAEAHAIGLRVIPWTVNDPEEMTRLIDMGIDGLITDRPDLFREAHQKMVS